MLTVQTFAEVARQYFPEPHASLLNGILFGVDLNHKSVFYTQLKMVGLLHLVVLSGMNITLLGSLTAVVTARFGRYVSILITAIVIIIFIIFVGPKAPIVRAGIMGILTLAALYLGRKPIAIYTLVLSALLIAFLWPQWIGTISFQLSFGATLGIILFSAKARIGKSFIREEFRTSLAAQVFTAPLIFMYFKQVSLISPFVNVMVAFIIAPIMVFGFLTVLLGKISYILGYVFSLPTMAMLTYIVWVVELTSKIPHAFISF